MTDGTEAYTAFSEGSRLLAAGDVHAAAVALERARALEPAKGSIREALARAYYRSGRFAAAEIEFRAALELDPVNDYAHFGVGLCRLKAGDATEARGHLRLAAAMRPDNDDYRQALDRAQRAAGLDVPDVPDGPDGPGVRDVGDVGDVPGGPELSAGS